MPVNEASMSEAGRIFELRRKFWVGFYLIFNTSPPNPGTPFSIIIRGLKHNGEYEPVEELKFKDKMNYQEIRN